MCNRGADLAAAYASADAFLFASQTDTFGQVILEAQASGLPVVAVPTTYAGSEATPVWGLTDCRGWLRSLSI